MKDCIFCKIVKGEIPSEKVYEDEYMLVIKDIQPQTEIHLVGIPKVHFKNIAHFTNSKPGVASHFNQTLAKLGNELTGGNEKNFNGNFKLLYNSGAEAGQTVFHVHGHILGGAGLDKL